MSGSSVPATSRAKRRRSVVLGADGGATRSLLKTDETRHADKHRQPYLAPVHLIKIELDRLPRCADSPPRHCRRGLRPAQDRASRLRPAGERGKGGLVPADLLGLMVRSIAKAMRLEPWAASVAHPSRRPLRGLLRMRRSEPALSDTSGNCY